MLRIPGGWFPDEMFFLSARSRKEPQEACRLGPWRARKRKQAREGSCEVQSCAPEQYDWCKEIPVAQEGHKKVVAKLHLARQRNVVSARNLLRRQKGADSRTRVLEMVLAPI